MGSNLSGNIYTEENKVSLHYLTTTVFFIILVSGSMVHVQPLRKRVNVHQVDKSIIVQYVRTGQ